VAKTPRVRTRDALGRVGEYAADCSGSEANPMAKVAENVLAGCQATHAMNSVRCRASVVHDGATLVPERWRRVREDEAVVKVVLVPLE